MRGRLGARALIAGGAIIAAQGVVAQAVQGGTDVSDDAWSFPWAPGTFVVMCLVLALAYAGVAVGLAGRGPAVAAGGAALIALAELGSIAFAEDAADATGPATLAGVFGLGTLLMGVGLLVAARRAEQRTAWLAAGLWTMCLTAVAATDLLAAGVALQGALLLAVGVATTVERAAPR